MEAAQQPIAQTAMNTTRTALLYQNLQWDVRLRCLRKLQNLNDHDGHIVMLRGSRHERIRIPHYAIDHFDCRPPPTRSYRGHQSLLLPFFIGEVHRFTDSVRKEHDHISARL